MGFHGWSILTIIICIAAVFWDTVFDEKKKK